MNEEQSIEETRKPEDDFEKPYRTRMALSSGISVIPASDDRRWRSIENRSPLRC